MTKERRAFIWLLLGVISFSAVKAGSITVSVSDSNAKHVYAPGTSFSITVTVSRCNGSCGSVLAQWRNFQDTTIGLTIKLNFGASVQLNCPSTTQGFYDLAIYTTTASDTVNSHPAGQPKRFGFAILPNQPAVNGRTWNSASQFGMVMAGLNDPWLPNCWVKTMTWDSTPVKQWSLETEKRRNRGRAEVPLILDDPWDTNDVARIKSKIKPLLQADTTTIYWELGLEENLGSGYGTSAYFTRLATKVQACRDASTEVGNPAQFIYQIVGTSYDKSFQQFLASSAASKFQILSVHPYRWNAFESPESWLEKFLVDLRTGMNNAGYNAMKIWITEVGAPINTNPDGHFGYPGINVKGITRSRQADYLTKVNVLALRNGVEKVFWYNYKDQKFDYTSAEENFGIVDYWGYLKPAYVANYNLLTKLSYRTPGSFKKKDGTGSNVWAYSFTGNNDIVIVAWLYPNASAIIPLDTIFTGLTASQVVSITNNVGTALSLSGEKMSLSASPVFITITIIPTSCDTVVCSNGGTCSGGTCMCLFPYTGTTCTGCSCVHGTCTAGACVCASGWTGSTCSTPTSGGNSKMIYDDAVSSGWSVSNARSVVNHAVTPAWAGTYCFSMKNTGGWGNLVFDYSSSFSTNGYTHLHFAVKASVNRAVLSLAACLTWNSNLVYKDITCTTSWQELYIPLTDINAVNMVIQTVLFIENDAATNNIFYLDKIELVQIK